MATKTKKSKAVEVDPRVAIERTVMEAVNKKYGAGSMTPASDPSLEITRLATGVLSIDFMMKGGFARNRSVELYGSFNVGKTYLAFCLIAETQRNGGKCAFFDAEGTFDPAFAESAGVNLKALKYHRQRNAEDLVDLVATFLLAGIYDVIIVDSIAALIPQSEKDGQMSDGSMGMEQAKLMSKALRKLTACNSMTSLVFINQTRQAVGVRFGKQTTTSGGRSMGFYATTRLELTRTENIKAVTKTIKTTTGEEEKSAVTRGHRVLVTCDKEKSGATHQGDQTTFVYDYRLGGIDPVEDLMYLGRKTKLVRKKGSKWWLADYEDEVQNGRNRFKSYLRKHPALAAELEESIREHIGLEVEHPEDELVDVD